MASDRRAFLINAARLAGGLVIASCAPSTTSVPSASSEAAVKKDLIVGASGEVIDGQPFNQSRGDYYGQVHSALYDTVTSRDEGFKLAPGLATSWKALDATTWQFKFRSGVKFHNGDPFTAADVKWSIEHTYDPAAKTIYATSFNTVGKMDVLDDLTLNVITKVPDPFLPDKLSVRPGYVMPAKYFQAVGAKGMDAKPIGSGPYMFKERVPGISFTLVKNPEYWRGKPDADTITLLNRPDQSARLAALKTGEVNFTVSIPYDQIDAINATPTAKVIPVPDNGTTFYIINTKVKPLDNKLIRQALSLAIDRPGLNKSLYKGLNTIANSHIASFEFAYDPKLPPLPYDPDKAKSLMKQAGYAGEKITLEYNPQGEILLLDQALGEAWKKVGFNIEMVAMDSATRARKIANLGFLGVTWARFASKYGDPDGVIWRTLQPGGSLRYWTNGEFDRLGAEQASSSDQTRRAAIWKRMIEIMLDETVYLSLWVVPITWGISKKLDVVPTVDAQDDFGPGHIKFKA